MTKREIGFLLIGLGAGLIVAVAAIIEFVLWSHHMFVVGIQWHPALIVMGLPFLFVLIGVTLLYRGKSQSNSN
jgi:gamma-glutamyl-gamma-aminobutyrate hydrolase PuuD